MIAKSAINVSAIIPVAAVVGEVARTSSLQEKELHLQDCLFLLSQGCLVFLPISAYDKK